MTLTSTDRSAPMISLASLAGAEMAELKLRFPPRPRPTVWPETQASREEVLDRLTHPPLWSASAETARMVGARRLLRWLERFPGTTWQQRWLASPADESPDALMHDLDQWVASTGQKPNRAVVLSGLLVLMMADVVRPDMPWFIGRGSRFLRRAIQEVRDPEGFSRVEEHVAPHALQGRLGAEARLLLAQFIVVYGGRIKDITVGDFLRRMEMTDSRRTGGIRMAYHWLLSMGQFPPDAPATLRHIVTRSGQVTPAQLVDRYDIKCRPVRDLLVDYLTERQPTIDYNTLRGITQNLVGMFWTDLERHHPGIDSLHLSPEVSAAWKERIAVKTIRRRQSDGTILMTTEPRLRAVYVKSQIRAFYLDLMEWAVDEPERWGLWAVPCPIGENECATKKVELRTKADMDRRTRERLPLLPALVRVAAQRLKDARARLDALRAAELGETFTVLGETFTAPATTSRGEGRPVQAMDSNGRWRYLASDESQAFFGWATVEILRQTGIRIEELQELGHHSIISYRLPTTGQIVPLLQIAPSKTDQERLLLVTPELADVLSAVISRVRGQDGRVPAVASYDKNERVWNEPLPLLFQYAIANEYRPYGEAFIRRSLNGVLDAAGLTDNLGNPLRFQPHDFRRIFITDAILNGLPPHIAQVIAGHRSITTTMGYAAIYPKDTIEAHRAFIARRRALRPVEEYRSVTPEEWQEFLGHFERRKLALGDCGRAYGTDCVHEHACVRCPVLIVSPIERPRLIEIRDNLADRIAEAEREGWLGEVEGLSTSLAAAEEKIAQLNANQERKESPVFLGIPTLDRLVARVSEATNSDPAGAGRQSP
ncbi:tyrosine-type recombinase/integrase [Streptomyces rubiginosohelvolus]|uniref:site-specific integrase n=1 Tax=Streptomyces globisporus TaxID=1908 RepID=UPI00177D9BC1|nr:integrase [Streptomyces globisporus]